MTMTPRVVMLTFAVLLSSPLHSQDTPLKASLPPSVGTKQTAAASAPKPHESEGQRIFEQNCSRCHNAPEGFSSRISGTIVRHMRVRASLSRHDEEELLHFLNP
jgi:cytochrome c5